MHAQEKVQKAPSIFTVITNSNSDQYWTLVSIESGTIRSKC